MDSGGVKYLPGTLCPHLFKPYSCTNYPTVSTSRTDHCHSFKPSTTKLQISQTSTSTTKLQSYISEILSKSSYPLFLVMEVDQTFARAYDLWRQECEKLDRENKASQDVQLEVEETEPENMSEPSDPEAEDFKVNLPDCEEDGVPETTDPEANQDIHADVPDMLSSSDLEAWQEKIKVESAQYKVKPDETKTIFEYDGKQDPLFTPQEQYIFSRALQQYRKEIDEARWKRTWEPSGIFSPIAELLPGRSYKDCHNYYYLHKWDGRFQNKALKEKRGDTEWMYQQSDTEVPDTEMPLDDDFPTVSRSGRILKSSKKAASDDASKSTSGVPTKSQAKLPSEVVVSPDSDFMASLRKQIPVHARQQVDDIFRTRKPEWYPQRVHLCLPSLDELEPASRQLFLNRQDYMLNWLKSPMLFHTKEWLDTVTSDGRDHVFKRFLATFPTRAQQIDKLLGQKLDGTPFMPLTPSEACQCVADAVKADADRVVHNTSNCEEEIVRICQRSIQDISKGSRSGTVDEPELGDAVRSRLIADILLWAYNDCTSYDQGYFGTLLSSPLARLQDFRVRAKLKDCYVISVIPEGVSRDQQHNLEIMQELLETDIPWPSEACIGEEFWRDLAHCIMQLSPKQRDQLPPCLKECARRVDAALGRPGLHCNCGCQGEELYHETLPSTPIEQDGTEVYHPGPLAEFLRDIRQ